MTNKKIILNYDFKLKDLEATTERHANRITKVKQTIKAGNLENDFEGIESAVEANIYNSSFYTYLLIKPNSWINGLKPQARLKAIKSQVNDQTRQAIRRVLEWNELPQSWDTAYYLVNYRRINQLMVRLARYFNNLKIN